MDFYGITLRQAEHLFVVAEDRDAWRIQLKLLPPQHLRDKQVQKTD